MVSSFPLKKNTACRIIFPILDADGDPVGTAAGLDSEYSIDGGAFGDCTNEATNMTSGAVDTGVYYLDLVAGETNGDWICIKVYTSTAGAKTTILVYQTAAQTEDETDAIIDNIHDTDLPAVKTDTGDIKTMTDKIGIVTNTGGTATIGAVLGDFANSALVTRVADLHTDVATVDTVLDNVHDTDLPAVKTDTTAILKISGNRWKISTVANTLTIYNDDGVTPLYVFNLKDSIGNAASTNVFERVPV